MKRSRNFAAIALITCLAVGTFAVTACSSQNDSMGDRAASAADAGSDGWITTKVKAELATTPGVKSGDVSVTTDHGVVTLTGVLPNEIAVKKAVAAAKSIKGVTDVDASGLKSKD